MESLRQPMQHVHWVQPALLWDGQSFQALADSPVELVEIPSDNFLPDFLDAMQAAPDRQSDGTRAPVRAVSYLNDHRITGPEAAQQTLKLFQPLHGRFYLVVASLVCQTAGLPDKTVSRQNNERLAFVVRRVRHDGGEDYWDTALGWTALDDCSAPASEERFPLQPVQVLTGHRADHPLFPQQRTLYYGYVVTGNREKYQKRPVSKMAFLEATNTTPAQKLNEYFALAQENGAPFDYHAHEFETRVLANWRMLMEKGSKLAGSSSSNPPGIPDRSDVAASVIIDLGDFVRRALPGLWRAIKTSTAPDMLNKPDQHALYDMLNGIAFPGQTGTKLGDALRTHSAIIDKDAAHGGADIPTDTAYDLRTSWHPAAMINGLPLAAGGISLAHLESGGFLMTLVKAALAEHAATQGAKVFPDDQVESMLALVKGLVRPSVVQKNGQPVADTYQIRLIYDYKPDCPPVVSRASRPFELAKYFDPDAPPRLTRLEMPSIRPRDLRKYAHGVGIQMSSDLREVMARLNPDMLKGEGLGPQQALGLDMICTFSIPIITLVALIVMFIFLILFNIIFWWMAFLRICLPVPKFEE